MICPILLHIDNDPLFRDSFKRLFGKAGFQVRSCRDSREAGNLRPGIDFSMLVTDSSGFEFVNKVGTEAEKLLIVNLTASLDISAFPASVRITKSNPDWYLELLNVLKGFLAENDVTLSEREPIDIRDSPVSSDKMENPGNNLGTARFDPLFSLPFEKLDEYRGKILIVAILRNQVVATANSLFEAEQTAKNVLANEPCRFVQGPPLEDIPLEEMECL